MSDDEVTEIELEPPQLLRDRVRREHTAALAPRPRAAETPIPVNRAELTELLKPDMLRRHAESLPVLAAFQEFLDVERRRARGRMLVLTSLFLIVLLAAGGAAALVGYSYYLKTSNQAATMQASLERLSSRVEEDQGGALGALSSLQARAKIMEQTFDSQMATFEVEQNGLSSLLSGMNTNLAGLHGTIARLQNANAQLHNQVERNAADWQAVTNRVEEILALLAPPVRLPTPEPVATARPPSPVPESPGAAAPPRDSMVLAILPVGGKRAVDWRVSLPAIQE
ncbi:MAG: hypothetical protein HN919_07810 [Verrucomicrobia bacterium]|jgi:hypothetical protein|nr:hypothetical protein [Verrucomicrobiota bacterium]MBT7066192.1 hypothetical protein [Verrucomicrobiota bacterium]MBT7698783.1 hypothetical protein [Verrucomicrobiota bacterium]